MVKKKQSVFNYKHCNYYGINISSRDLNGIVDTVVCMFCMVYGRECDKDSESGRNITEPIISNMLQHSLMTTTVHI